MKGERKRAAFSAKRFREIALSLPEAVESEHMAHPDFRVRGKVFASLLPGEAIGMVKLTPDEQARFVAAAPEVFVPAQGAWGKRGCTYATLALANESKITEVLRLAWCNTAPKSLIAKAALRGGFDDRS